MRIVTADRRTRRTRAAIEGAFSELIQKKDINKITIKDITEKADTNRSTFYTHYEDIYDLLRVVEDKLINRIVVLHNNNILDESARSDMTESLQYISDNRSLFSAIINSSQGSVFLNRLCDVLGGKLMALFDKVPDNDMVVTFYTNGAIAVIRDWLNSDTNSMSAEQMCRFIEHTIRVGINALNNADT